MNITESNIFNDSKNISIDISNNKLNLTYTILTSNFPIHIIDLFSYKQLTIDEINEELNNRIDGVNNYNYLNIKYNKYTNGVDTFSKEIDYKGSDGNIYLHMGSLSGLDKTTFVYGDIGYYYIVIVYEFSNRNYAQIFVNYINRRIRAPYLETVDKSNNLYKAHITRDLYIQNYSKNIYEYELSNKLLPSCGFNLVYSTEEIFNDYYGLDLTDNDISIDILYFDMGVFTLRYSTILNNNFEIYLGSIGYYSFIGYFNNYTLNELFGSTHIKYKFKESSIKISNQLEVYISLDQILSLEIPIDFVKLSIYYENSIIKELDADELEKIPTTLYIPLDTITIDNQHYVGQEGNYFVKFSNNTTTKNLCNYYYKSYSSINNEDYIKLLDLDPYLMGYLMDFKYIKNSNTVTLLTDLFGDYKNLNLKYFYKSQNKLLSPLIYMLMYTYNGEQYKITPVLKYLSLSSSGISALWDMISNECYPNWKRIYDTYYSEIYNALKPYDMSVNISSTDKLSSDDTINSSNTNESSSTNNSKATNNKNANNRYAFNSGDNPIKVDENLNSFDNTDTGSSTSKDTKNKTSNYKRDKNFESLVTRIGNIGNISKQDLITKELNLRKFKLQELILTDMDKYFVCQKYI